MNVMSHSTHFVSKTRSEAIVCICIDDHTRATKEHSDMAIN